MNTEMIFLVIVFVVSGICFFYKNLCGDDEAEGVAAKEEDSQSAEVPEEIARKVEFPFEGIEDTGELVKAVLKKMGFEFEEFRDGLLGVTYQGENLLIDHTRDKKLLVYDLRWFSVPLDDTDGVIDAQKAIAQSNRNFLPVKFHYDIHDEDKTLDVSSYSFELFIPQIPNIDRYLREVFDNMMVAHSVFCRELDRVRSERINTQMQGR